MGETRCKDCFLKFLDLIFSLVWVCHLVVACWRGTWNLLDLYVLPGDQISGTWISYFGGIVLCATIKSTYPTLHNHVSSEQKATRFIFSRLSMYILTWGTIGQWRGIWNILDRAMDTHWQSNTCSLALTLLLMWFFRISINIIATPFFVGYDFRSNLFVSLPRFRTPSERYWDYVNDHVISQLIVETLVVSVWRALWNIYNDVIFPTDFLFSNLVTWGAGIGGYLFLIAFQDVFLFMSRKGRNCGFGCKLIIENINVLLSFASLVAIWRGWWNILEGILLPDPLFGGALCHVVGVICLFGTGTMSSLFAPSVGVDGECATGLRWPIEYFQIIFRKKKNKQSSLNSLKQKEENVMKLSSNGEYLKCSADFEFEDLQLTSI